MFETGGEGALLSGESQEEILPDEGVGFARAGGGAADDETAVVHRNKMQRYTFFLKKKKRKG